jgi:hypothetical protein
VKHWQSAIILCKRGKEGKLAKKEKGKINCFFPFFPFSLFPPYTTVYHKRSNYRPVLE